MSLNFTSIDFETATPQRNSVCSMGLCKVIDGEIVGTVYTTVFPPSGLVFNPYNQKIHGLTPDDVRNSPTWDLVWHNALPMIGNDILVAHNAAFERSVIKQSLAEFSMDPPPYLTTLCSVKLAKKILVNHTKHKLPIVAEHYGVPVHEHHNAGDDARVGAEIVIAMARHMGAHSLEELATMTGLQPAPF